MMLFNCSNYSSSWHPIDRSRPYWYTWKAPGLGDQIPLLWFIQGPSFCPRWSWCHDRHSRTPRSKHSYPQVCTLFLCLLRIFIKNHHFIWQDCYPKRARWCCSQPRMTKTSWSLPRWLSETRSCLSRLSSLSHIFSNLINWWCYFIQAVSWTTESGQHQTTLRHLQKQGGQISLHFKHLRRAYNRTSDDILPRKTTWCDLRFPFWNI